jgi:hypothetical protein
MFAAIYLEETYEMIAWVPLEPQHSVCISREGSNNSETIGTFESIQDAVDVMTTRVCLGMLYEGT